MTDQNKSVSEQAKCKTCYGVGLIGGTSLEDQEKRFCPDCPTTVPAAAMVMQPVDERAIDVLGGAIKMVVNMLNRDDKPIRTEAAGALLAAFGTVAEQARAALSAGPTQAADAKDKRILFLEGLVNAYGPKSLQYDIEHPTDGLNATPAAEQTATTASASIDTPAVDLQYLQKHAEIVADYLMKAKTALGDKWMGALDEALNHTNYVRTALKPAVAQAPSQDAPAAVALLNRAHRVISCAAIALIRDGEATWADIGKYLKDNAAAAAQAVEQAVPDGWKLVPLQPTNKMTYIGQDLRYASVNSIGEIYRQMLAAAPAAPAVEPNQQQECAKCRRTSKIVKLAENCPFCNPAPAGKEPTQAARDVLAERRRQVEIEGWTEARDDHYAKEEMARAAACYALRNTALWPWSIDWWKPTTPRRNLVKAGALILAEIERIDRTGAQAAPQGKEGGV